MWWRSKNVAVTDPWRQWIQSSAFLDMVPNARNIQTRLLRTLGEECQFTNDVFVTAADYGDKRYLWGLHGAHGRPKEIAIEDTSNEKWRRADQLATNTYEPQAAFYALRGSWFVDWNLSENGFMRACLATATNGLAAVWVTDGCAGPWRMERLALGCHLGAMLQDTLGANAAQSARAVYVLGDPTLCAHVIAPPTGLGGYATNSGGLKAVLDWTDSPEEDYYVVYRGSSVEAAIGNPIANVAQNVTTYTDAAPQSGRSNYLVRAVKHVFTGAGSFLDLSRAASTTVVLP